MNGNIPLIANMRMDRLEKRVKALEEQINDIKVLIIANNSNLDALLQAVHMEQSKGNKLNG